MNPVDPMDQVGAVLGIALLYFAFQAGLGIALALVFYGRVKQSWGCRWPTSRPSRPSAPVSGTCSAAGSLPWAS